MSLAVGNEKLNATHSEIIRDLVGKEEFLLRWVEHPSSSLLHHDQDCCEEARLWFLSYAHSMEIGSLSRFDIKAPTWLTEFFTWGPSEWPISWCQLVKQDVIDCGVFAALAREIFKAQGHAAHPAQAILSYNETCTNHWKELWKKEIQDNKEIFPWIGNEVVYHELCCLELPDGNAKFYDSTWGNWFTPHQQVGFGAFLAIKTDCPRLLRWGDKLMSCGEWIDL